MLDRTSMVFGKKTDAEAPDARKAKARNEIEAKGLMIVQRGVSLLHNGVTDSRQLRLEVDTVNVSCCWLLTRSLPDTHTSTRRLRQSSSYPYPFWGCLPTQRNGRNSWGVLAMTSIHHGHNIFPPAQQPMYLGNITLDKRLNKKINYCRNLLQTVLAPRQVAR
jgi:hypothetical protein